ncbi:MAG: hypothetical protein H8F28_00500 [Fibrella sp.]|nr:hypothetical protein [Armatimonadota bacterium]
MQVSKRWSIWLGICVVGTIPFLLRDIGQIVTFPTLLSASLPAPPVQLADAHDKAVVHGNLSARLVEVRTTVPGGYAGWEPRSATLPEESPLFREQIGSSDRYIGDLPEGIKAYRFAVQMEGLPESPMSALFTDDLQKLGTVAAWSDETQFWDRNTGGETWSNNTIRRVAKISNWMLFSRVETTTDLYAGVALPSDTVTLSQSALPGKIGLHIGAKLVLGNTYDTWDTPLEIELPADRRPRVAGQYLLRIQKLDSWGTATPAGSSVVYVSPTTRKIRAKIPTLLDRGNTDALRVTLTPYRWVRFADVPLTVPDTVPGGRRAVLRPLPIPLAVRQKIERIQVRGDTPSRLIPIVRARWDEWTPRQLLRPMPHEVVFSAPYQVPDEVTMHKYWDDYRMDVFLPDDFPRKETDAYTLVVTTPGGKHLRKVLPSENVGDRKRLTFLVEGFPSDIIREVSLCFGSPD